MKKDQKFKFSGLIAALVALALILAGCLPSEQAGTNAGGPNGEESQATAAMDYPQRNVEAINQFGPGGGTDVFIRAIAVPFEKITGKSLIPVSVTGGGGVPAFTEFMNRPADGHTLMAIGPEEVINHVMGRIDATKLYPIARIQYDQGLFFVSADSPYQTIEEVIAYAKENPEALSIGMTGAAGFDETLVGLWNIETGARLKIVPFDGSAEVSSALLGGHIDLMYEEYGPMLSLIQGGKVRPLVLFSEQRLAELPDVPTAVELGYNVTLGRWRGFALKQGDSPEHADALFKILQEAANDPEYKKYEEQNMLHYRSVLLGPEEFKTFFEDEIKVYTEVLKALGYIQ